MSDVAVPEPRVLTDAVLESMAGPKVAPPAGSKEESASRLIAAVFVTYELSPQFFEDSILSPLCGVESRGSAVIRRMNLEERLREMPEIVVVYDPAGLNPTDGPLRQRVRHVPVRWPAGVLHSKHALLLCEKAGERSLVLLTTSANLTQTGWWKNVEVADMERLTHATPTSLRDDLLGLIGMIGELAAEPLPALEQIRAFALGLTTAPGLPRLWLGAEPLSAFLAAQIPARGVRLELVAPFVDDRAEPIARLVGALNATETVVWFPRDKDEAGAALETWRDGVNGIPGAGFGDLAVDRSLGRGVQGNRFVHAKVIRVTDGASKRTWTLSGSPNLSNRGHAGWRTTAPASNIETAVLRVAPGVSRWLQPLAPGKEPAPAAVVDDADDAQLKGLALRVRFDWAAGSAAVRLSGKLTTVSLGPATATTSGGAAGTTVAVNIVDDWVPLADSSVDWLRRELETGNVISVWSAEAPPTPILVEEHGMAQRPSRVAKDLTAADILQHWALLSEAQRAAHLEAKLALGNDDPEAPTPSTTAGDDEHGPTMFDTFSGILHGFLILKTRLTDAVTLGQLASVDAWLLGNRHDSLPTLLDKVLEDKDDDGVRRVVFGLCARELLAVTRLKAAALIAERGPAVAALEAQITKLEGAWDALDVRCSADEPPGAFRSWLQGWWSSQAGGAS